MTDTAMLARMEWDFPDIDKGSWGPGEWLNEPDKVQCTLEGLPCLMLRSHHGGWCGYVGVPQGHPYYGMDYNGIPSMVAEIMRADFRDKLAEWGKKGRPLTPAGLPDIEHWDEPQVSELGNEILNIWVHGGLTFSGTCTTPTEATWHELVDRFTDARVMAQRYPDGDAAHWLHKWEPAEYSYEKFLEICKCSCMVIEPPELTDQYWFFGFDCAHAGDLMPAIGPITEVAKHVNNIIPELPLFQMEEEKYRNLEFMEKECQELAEQLKGAHHDQNESSG